jgi:hypothetical protein
VVENDIGWRVHALVDFMFGRSVAIQSEVSAPGRAQQIERFLRTVFDRAGGVNFYQNLALLGAVYGFVDVLVRVAEAKPVGAMSPEAAARWFDLEPIEGPRAVPVLREADYRRWGGYMVHVRQPSREGADEGFLRRASRRVTGEPTAGGSVEHTEVWTADRHEWYRRTVGAFGGSRKLLLRETNRLGRIPVVHIQNLAQPLHYEGLSEVEPLIPLQDELNTRLSDRANRVTFQSFKMYLGKGIEGFTERSVGPGQMWATDNPEASIEEFGGDAQNPSEDAHIQEIRQALDKTSAVPPVAAGLLAGRVGNLTSENALRVVDGAFGPDAEEACDLWARDRAALRVAVARGGCDGGVSQCAERARRATRLARPVAGGAESGAEKRAAEAGTGCAAQASAGGTGI